MRASGEDFLGLKDTRLDAHHYARAGLLNAHLTTALRTASPLGDELHAGQCAIGSGGGMCALRAGPTESSHVHAQPRQQLEGPPFLSSSSSSYRSNTKRTSAMGIGGACPRRRRATCAGDEPGWRISTNKTSMTTASLRVEGPCPSRNLNRKSRFPLMHCAHADGVRVMATFLRRTPVLPTRRLYGWQG